MLTSNSNLMNLIPTRRDNFDMYVRRGVYADWDLGIGQEVRDVYYWDQLRSEPVSHILDIGAHIGFYTTTALGVWPDATIVPVEPEKDNFALLALNTARFTNVLPLWGAVARDPLTQQGRVLKAHSNSGGHIVKLTTQAEPEQPETPGYTTQSYYIPLFTLEDVVARAFAGGSVRPGSTPKLLIKLDCEGGEWDAVASEAAHLATYIVGEYHYPLSKFAERVEYYLPEFTVRDYQPANQAQGLFFLRKG